MPEGTRSGSCSEDCDVRIARVVGGHSEHGMSTVCLESPVCRFVTGSGKWMYFVLAGTRESC